jgi:hypothetical protein
MSYAEAYEWAVKWRTIILRGPESVPKAWKGGRRTMILLLPLFWKTLRKGLSFTCCPNFGPTPITFQSTYNDLQPPNFPLTEVSPPPHFQVLSKWLSYGNDIECLCHHIKYKTDSTIINREVFVVIYYILIYEYLNL